MYILKCFYWRSTVFIILTMGLSGSLIAGSGDSNNLLTAIRTGDYEQVRQLIDEGNDLNRYEQGQNIALSLAARREQAEIARLLIQRGARPATDAGNNYGEGCEDEHGYTNILNHAVGDIETLRVLLEGGANPNVVAYCGDVAPRFPLVTAVQAYPQRTSLAAIRTLLNFGANPNYHNDEPETMPLFVAIEHNDPELVRMLLYAGAEVNELPVKRSRACRKQEAYQTAMDLALGMKSGDDKVSGRWNRNNDAVIQALQNSGGITLKNICRH